MIRQLIFDLPAAARVTRADFFTSPANALVLETIDQWRDWPSRKMMLIGPRGAGKSHLAQIWATDAKATVVPAGSLADIDLSRIAADAAIALEDADTLAGQPSGEALLFHLHNLLAVSGTLLMTAVAPPRDWGLSLPDLASRMQATPMTRLEPPDDALLGAVLAKLFADRQLEVPGNLIPYLLARMDRSITAARALVDALDARALAQHRPITRVLAGEILESHVSE